MAKKKSIIIKDQNGDEFELVPMINKDDIKGSGVCNLEKGVTPPVGSIMVDDVKYINDPYDPINTLLNSDHKYDNAIGRIAGNVYNDSIGDMGRPSFANNKMILDMPFDRVTGERKDDDSASPTDFFTNTIMPVRNIAVDMVQASSGINGVKPESVETFRIVNQTTFSNTINYMLRNAASDIRMVLSSLISKHIKDLDETKKYEEDNKNQIPVSRSLKYMMNSVYPWITIDIFPHVVLSELDSYYTVHDSRYGGEGRVEKEVLKVSASTIPIIACNSVSDVYLKFYNSMRVLYPTLVNEFKVENGKANEIIGKLIMIFEADYYDEIASYIFNLLEECSRIAYIYLANMTRPDVKVPFKSEEINPPFSYKFRNYPSGDDY